MLKLSSFIGYNLSHDGLNKEHLAIEAVLKTTGLCDIKEPMSYTNLRVVYLHYYAEIKNLYWFQLVTGLAKSNQSVLFQQGVARQL